MLLSLFPPGGAKRHLQHLTPTCYQSRFSAPLYEGLPSTTLRGITRIEYIQYQITHGVEEVVCCNVTGNIN